MMLKHATSGSQSECVHCVDGDGGLQFWRGLQLSGRAQVPACRSTPGSFCHAMLPPIRKLQCSQANMSTG